MRGLEKPRLGTVRIGEGTPLEAEQFRLEQRLRDGRTVDVDERPLRPRALAMQHARDESLPRAGIALKEDRG
jgi:hypothetical protein